MAEAINEIALDVGDKETELPRIVDRVQTLMSTHYGTIKRESKLREKAKNLRTLIWRRMTENQSKFWEIIGLNPREKGAVAQAKVLNKITLELQRLSLDETALTLIIRKNMSDEEIKQDKELRAERHAKANRVLNEAAGWVDSIPALQDGTQLELSVLTSETVPPIDDEYDTTIIEAAVAQEEQEIIQQAVEEEERQRAVSPEPTKPTPTITPLPRDLLFH